MNENIIHALWCDTVCNQWSQFSQLNIQANTLRPRISFGTTRSYKNYDHDSFIEDLANFPFGPYS